MNTLLLCIPILALTDGMTDGGTNTLASRGLEEPFFPVVLLCCISFWLWREMRELALHYYFPADCFGIEREIVFGVMYVLSVQYSCAVVSVFLYYDRKKKF